MTKLNLGCKHRKLDGFENLDKIFGWNFQDGLPQYGDSSVDAITISHALMFLTPSELVEFMKEMWRVLKLSGVVRITEDDTENPKSNWYKTGNLKSGPNCLTGPKMIRGLLEDSGFIVFNQSSNTTLFKDSSLMQAYRGEKPNVFFIEGIKCKVPKRRNDLPQFFVDLGFKVGAEIGVYKAEFSSKLASTGIKLYSIDPWQKYSGTTQQRQNQLYEYSKKVLSPYPKAKIIRKTSMEALNDFKDESLDFVYIDANHEFKFISEDLFEWTKKVKKGGIVAGHDYYFTKRGTDKIVRDVGNVVDAYVAVFGLENLYLLHSDEIPSWMYFKI